MVRRWALLLLFGLLLAGLLALPATGQAERQVFLLRLQGPLTPAMAEYLDRGLGLAARESAEAVVLQLDTPGGAVDVMNRMVQSIRASQVPVVVYVAPRGAIAGSAGTVLTLAGHVAAMAPETAIGAASPVGPSGEDLGETLEAKAKEIIKATARSLAARRGERAIELAEATIEEAKAVSAQEALEAGLIDLVAEDVPDLLERLEGFEVEVAGGRRTLHTAGAEVVEIEPSLVEQLLQALTNPNIVFLLLAIGVQAILIELSQPGGWVAGTVGVICLALGAYGLGVLPVNWFGLIFIILAFVLFILEINAPTHGALTVAGLLSFIAGALILFNSPGTPEFQRVSVPLVVIAAVVMGGIFVLILTFALRAQRRPAATGAEGLLGRVGTARTDLAPKGTVLVAGELWQAELEDPSGKVAAGDEVEVVAVEGLRLKVRPRSQPG